MLWISKICVQKLYTSAELRTKLFKLNSACVSNANLAHCLVMFTKRALIISSWYHSDITQILPSKTRRGTREMILQRWMENSLLSEFNLADRECLKWKILHYIAFVYEDAKI